MLASQTEMEQLGLAEATENRPIAALGVLAQERNNLSTRFQPGQTGNPHGRPKSAKFRRAFLKTLNQEIAAGATRLDHIADQLTDIAAGDYQTAAFIRDTVDGKPTSHDDSAVVNNICIEVVSIGGQ